MPLRPRHVVPIYVYTYELEGDRDRTEQIYGAMNRAMRLHDADALDFWRPLIWRVDCALTQLPTWRGRVYRGISVRFSEEDYHKGQKVCWPAFSSASAEQSVAEEFVKGDEGSLFFIQSTGARAISRYSKYPDEAEVSPSFCPSPSRPQSVLKWKTFAMGGGGGGGGGVFEPPDAGAGGVWERGSRDETHRRAV